MTAKVFEKLGSIYNRTIRRKARVRIPGQRSKRNMKKKIFLRREETLSRFLAKTLRINKPAMKKL